MWKSFISIKGKEKKRVRGMILGQKLTLNHPSLVDEGEETRVLVTAHKREREKYFFCRYRNCIIAKPIFHLLF